MGVFLRPLSLIQNALTGPCSITKSYSRDSLGDPVIWVDSRLWNAGPSPSLRSGSPPRRAGASVSPFLPLLAREKDARRHPEPVVRRPARAETSRANCGDMPMRPRVLWSGAILLTIGLSVLLLVGEWFAAFDACLANPVCVPPDSLSPLEGMLALVVIGVGLAVGGAMLALVGLRDGSHNGRQPSLRPDWPANL
jgi:hypothetical protein